MNIHDEINKLKWFHTVPLDDGTFTPGSCRTHLTEWRYMFDVLNFDGKTILDIGCWDGYYSFMAEKRGASKVVSLDRLDMNPGRGLGYKLLHKYFNSQAELRDGSIYKLNLAEKFDIVLCYGVLYHVADPLTAMINAISVAKERFCFEGLMTSDSEPIMTLIYPITEEFTTIYSQSIGWLQMVGGMCGFEIERFYMSSERRPINERRGAIIFKRITDIIPKYSTEIFEVPPLCLL